MQRRDFLKLAGLTGLSTMLPLSRIRSACAVEPYQGPLLLTINTIGGLDQTNLCDPKGFNRRYGAGDILTSGAIPYAPLDGNQAFFEKYSSELLIINGIDNGTNGHVEGLRVIGSGVLESRGFPSLGALFAAAQLEGQGVALPYLSFGGFDATAGLVPLARISNFPYLGFAANYEKRLFGDDYLEPFAQDAVADALRQHHEGRMAKTGLPRLRDQRGTLFTSQLSADQLKRFADYMPEDAGEVHTQQAAVSLATLASGIGAAANIYVSGFDTHTDHEDRHGPLLDKTLEQIDYALQRAEILGVRDRLTIVVASEMGRTPYYNESNGKDHWSISSMMMIGPGIRGNRVIGGTDDDLFAHPLNLDTLAFDDSGEKLRPAHIHQALREHFGIDQFADDRRFGLTEGTVPLFS